MRITITLNDKSIKLIKVLEELTFQSKSEIINNILNEENIMNENIKLDLILENQEILLNKVRGDYE